MHQNVAIILQQLCNGKISFIVLVPGHCHRPLHVKVVAFFRAQRIQNEIVVLIDKL